MANMNRCVRVRENALHITKGILSDRDILALNDTFLTSGFHTLTISHVLFGRKLLKRFLAQLSCYSQIAYMSTTHVDSADDQIFNIYGFLKARNIFYNEQALDEFLLEEFCFDFLWIEWSHEFLTEPWFASFKQKLIEFGIDREIPIIIVHTPLKCS